MKNKYKSSEVKRIKLLEVGEKTIDKSGNEWVVARLWDRENFREYELINTKTGEYGSKIQFTNNL